MLKIELSPAAEIDFDDAVAWYEAHDECVKIDFIEAVDSTLKFVQASPASFPITHGSTVRKALVKKFPFIVLFTVEADRIYVYSVFHTSRNPIVWRGRVG